MEIYASIRQKVNIDPIDVIKKLKDEALCGSRGWIFEREGKYYHEFETGGGSHSWDEEEEITKEKYDYVRALELIINYNKK